MSRSLPPPVLTLLLCCVLPACGAGQSIDACGRIEIFDSCTIFTSFENGYDWFLLEDYGGFQPGATVHVTGPFPWEYWDCGDHQFRGLQGNTIEACLPRDLGCGVLYEDPNEGCHTWISAAHGRFLTSLHGFSDGDTVRVVGFLDRSHASVCLIGDGSLLEEAFYDSCSGPTTAARKVSWGKLKSTFR
jgi:hypothetical protein